MNFAKKVDFGSLAKRKERERDPGRVGPGMSDLGRDSLSLFPFSERAKIHLFGKILLQRWGFAYSQVFNFRFKKLGRPLRTAAPAEIIITEIKLGKRGKIEPWSIVFS